MPLIGFTRVVQKYEYKNVVVVLPYAFSVFILRTRVTTTEKKLFYPRHRDIIRRPPFKLEKDVTKLEKVISFF